MASSSTSKRLSELLDPRFMARLDGLDLVSRKILQGKLQGERRSKRRGEGVEFADHRPYVVGDDLRFVDWNIFGRLDQLFLKLFLEEQDLSVHVLMDASASVTSGEPAKDLAIRRLGAALAYVSLVNNSRVTVSFFADGLIGQVPAMRGRNYLPQLAEFLLGSPAEGPSSFDKAAKAIVAQQTGRGVMIILSDFFFKEGYTTGLRRLLARHYDLYAIQVLSPQELEPAFAGDLKLVDLEDGDMAEVTISAALIKHYKRNLGAYCNELKDFLVGRNARYMLASSADSAEALVLNALRRGGLLR